MAGTDVLAGTVADLAARTRWLLLAEETPDRAGFLQGVTPATKVVGLVALVAVAATRSTPAGAGAMAALATALAVASRVPARAFLGRVAAPPALAFVVVAPQAVLMDGPALAGPVSVPGATYVLTFVVRVTACVALLSLLLVTTRFSALLAGLRRLRVPSMAVTLVAITYRYLLFVFAELERVVRAREARTRRDPGLGRTWRDSGDLLGSFLLRTLERGERVGRAARARGGTGAGYDRTPDPGVADLAFAALVAGVAAAAVVA